MRLEFKWFKSISLCFVRAFIPIDFSKTANHKTGIHGWELSEWQWPWIKIRTECSCNNLSKTQYIVSSIPTRGNTFYLRHAVILNHGKYADSSVIRERKRLLLLRTITKIYYYIRKTIKFFIVKNLKVLSIWNSLKLKYL